MCNILQILSCCRYDDAIEPLTNNGDLTDDEKKEIIEVGKLASAVHCCSACLTELALPCPIMAKHFCETHINTHYVVISENEKDHYCEGAHSHISDSLIFNRLISCPAAVCSAAGL